MTDSLLHLLQQYTATDTVPFHMPGHMRNAEFATLGALGASLDITEIDGFDNLHAPTGILRRCADVLRDLVGAKHSFLSVNGASGAILAALRTVLAPGDSILVARNCHRSVTDGIALCGAKPIWLMPPCDTQTGLCLSLPCDLVEAAIKAHPEAKVLLLTSPTYDGVLSDIFALCTIAHQNGVCVIVDEAHGAHLGFLGNSLPSAVRCGADIVVQSYHKTLPSLTQTAVAHLCSERIDAAAFARQMSVFETSSPSYLLLASLDDCIRRMATEPSSVFEPWAQALDAAEAALAPLKHLYRFSPKDVFGYDRSKLVISTANTTLSGTALSQILRTEYHIECEMATPFTVLAMTGAGTRTAHIQALGRALCDIDKTLHIQTPCLIAPPPLPCPSELALATLHRLPTERIPLELAIGRTAATSIFAYPPGVPVIAAAEVYDADTVDYLYFLYDQGAPLVCEAQDGQLWVQVVASA